MSWGRAEAKPSAFAPPAWCCLSFTPLSAPQTGGEEGCGDVLGQRAAEEQQGEQPEEPDEQQERQHAADLEQEKQAEQEQHLQHPLHRRGRQRGHVLRHLPG